MRRGSARSAITLAFLVLAGCTGDSGSASAGSESTAVSGAEGSPPAVLLEGGRLFIGDGTVIENGALLVRGHRIEAIGTAGELTLPEGGADGTRIDLSGRTVIPALVDAHAHLGYEGYVGWGAEHYSRDNLIDHLHRYAYYGFAAVLSAGSDPVDLALDLQRDQGSGGVGGARFLFAAGMAPPDQGPNDRFLVHTRAVAEEAGEPVVRGLSSPGDARRAVRQVAEKEISRVKIWVDDRGGSQEKLSPEIYRAVMDEARVRGLEVLVHQQNATDMPDLIRAGTDGFLHGRLGPDLDESIAELLAEEDVFLVPNLGLGELRRENVAADPFLREAVRPEVARRLDAERGGTDPDVANGAVAASLGRLLDAGVDIVLGTDAGAIPDHFFGYTGHRELEIFVRLGMTPTEALVAGTKTAAAALGLTDLGTLEAGKSADFVVLAENPTEDIRNTRSIVDVYLRGRRVKRDSLRAAWRASSTADAAATDPSPSEAMGTTAAVLSGMTPDPVNED